jgi:uncharacterized protein (TIGR00251 family)
MEAAGCWEKHADGTLVHVKALAAARKNELRGIENSRLKIATTAVPEKGQANAAITRQLAASLQVPPRQLELIRGASSNQKTFLVRGLSLAEVQQRLEA